MSEVLRTDSFFNESLVGLFGPAQIVKSHEASAGKSFLPRVHVVPYGTTEIPKKAPVIESNTADRYTAHGDILLLDGKGNGRVILSQTANSNTVLVTEQCDNLCKFCSQPPKTRDDSILFAFAAQALIAFNSQDFVGITGGEPLLNRALFLQFLDTLKRADCHTPLHLLTNGRAFHDLSFVKEFKDALHNRDLICGIPLYGTNSAIHDDLVGEPGAWSETIDGLINAGNHGLPIEIRVIPTKRNVEQLSSIVKLALESISSISSISIMNLEQEGWAKRHWDELYIPPYQYVKMLEQTLKLQHRYKIPIRLFNYPLCHLPQHLRQYACKSISDWKAIYEEECLSCSLKSDCGGFFVSQKHKWTNPTMRII
ncbi:His-Xaa-Ser system radical SAM maturase HxsC [Pseudoalteromonas sp. OOF1S-7]|uniref:His-Xaa-Ser system radical SAM maturase HxsC n=1 Tax=Pseudoalteromonas sp. OOF1S-7 TaxID=2917757 RepID=UPI001EF4C9C0|nr:His-Xaa-Ser system radical SAM maturase HxsC [Pseudoalteromonas sp. OOF1S-7]MCG7535812.1 His-Xaa-Ser system radical SAM maturase HxsC [Pseudoalteromonas sp. OOF1S-7]